MPTHGISEMMLTTGNNTNKSLCFGWTIIVDDDSSCFMSNGRQNNQAVTIAVT